MAGPTLLVFGFFRVGFSLEARALQGSTRLRLVLDQGAIPFLCTGRTRCELNKTGAKKWGNGENRSPRARVPNIERTVGLAAHLRYSQANRRYVRLLI